MKQGNRIASEHVHAICILKNSRLTNNLLLKHFHNGWMLVGHSGKSIIDSENFLFKIDCQPRAVRLELQKAKIKGTNQYYNDRKLTWKRCSNFIMRRISKEANFNG